MRSVKATFFLPLRDNDNRDLSGEISEVEDACFLAFGDRRGRGPQGAASGR